MSQDLSSKRQNIARNAIVCSQQFVDALNGLLELKDERAKLGSPFSDTDFAGIDGLKHLTAGIIDVLFDDVVPSLQANYVDSGNGGRNEQNLLQMRK